MKDAHGSTRLPKKFRRVLTVAIIIAFSISLLLYHRSNSPDTYPVQYSNKAAIPQNNSPNITVVVSSTSNEDTEWLEAHFPQTSTAVYIVDAVASQSPFQTPANKGNEAMVYLTYIIDHYDRLPAVAVFIHAHLRSEHTDNLLGNSMVETLQRLCLEKVRRDGYFNLRCNWEPGGCPQYMNLRDPQLSAYNASTQAQKLKQAWSELFPGRTEWPEWVGQPYGAQFAASRDAIRRVSLSTWVRWREWLLASKLSNHDSGRVWEYSWQYVLAATANFCPDMDRCYCEGYGVCFGGEEALEEWSQKVKALEESWALYLTAKPTGKESIELKKRLIAEREALDKIFQKAKDTIVGPESRPHWLNEKP